MKEKPILFSTEMVSAILEGRKTQTRRIIKPQLPFYKFDFCGNNEAGYSAMTTKGYVEFRGYEITEKGERIYSPFCIKPKHGEKNDILWVRETWSLNPFYDKDNPVKYLYMATDKPFENHKWKPSIYMPKEACRIRLKIKSIKIERLLDISEQDAIAEGIDYTKNGTPSEGYSAIWYKNYILNDCPFLKGNIKHSYNSSGSFSSAVMSYLTLWNKINGVDSHKQNPWIWVIEFEKLKS